MKERTVARSAPRSPLNLEAELVAGPSGDPRTVRVLTRDLGVGGALCESPEALPEGSSVSLCLSLPATRTAGPETVVIPAIISRVEGSGPCTLALRFGDPRSAPIRALGRFLLRARDPMAR